MGPPGQHPLHTKITTTMSKRSSLRSIKAWADEQKWKSQDGEWLPETPHSVIEAHDRRVAGHTNLQAIIAKALGV